MELGDFYDVGASVEAMPTDALADMRTNRQGRAVLGVTAHYLKLGYQQAEKIPTSLWSGVLTRKIDGTAKAAQQARELLDGTRKFAEKIYANLPNNNEPISAANRKKVSVAFKQAATNLQLVSTAERNLNRGFTSDVVDAIHELGKQAGRELKRAAKESMGLLAKLAIAAGVVGGGYLIFKLWSSKRTAGDAGGLRVLDSNRGNPPHWVHPDDIGKWEQAVDAVKPYWDSYDSPYAVVTHVYKEMHGRIVAADESMPVFSNREVRTVPHRLGQR